MPNASERRAVVETRRDKGKLQHNLKRRWKWAKKNCRALPGTVAHPRSHADSGLVARLGRDPGKTTTRGGSIVNGARARRMRR